MDTRIKRIKKGLQSCYDEINSVLAPGGICLIWSGNCFYSEERQTSTTTFGAATNTSIQYCVFHIRERLGANQDCLCVFSDIYSAITSYLNTNFKVAIFSLVVKRKEGYWILISVLSFIYFALKIVNNTHFLGVLLYYMINCFQFAVQL